MITIQQFSEIEIRVGEVVEAVNKKFLFVTNLEYKKMMDEESQGMILAVGDDGEKPIFVEVPNLPMGSKVR